ncbi:MAG: response regulator, partial [Saprospiraceae bacterium]|nr:response regulator [Saprospiraceae bacterium]
MNILIIEDEKLAAEKLVNLLEEIGTHFNILAVLDSVEDSISYLKSQEEPDLVLSDIHLTDGLCFSIFSTVEISCPVIFTTAYEKYAIQAFEVNSIDYLLKPIQKDRLQSAIEKYRKLAKHSSEDQMALYEDFRKLLSHQNRDHKSRFLCKLGNRIKSVPVESIRFFYSENKLTFIIDINGQRYPVNHTLD